MLQSRSRSRDKKEKKKQSKEKKHKSEKHSKKEKHSNKQKESKQEESYRETSQDRKDQMALRQEEFKSGQNNEQLKKPEEFQQQFKPYQPYKFEKITTAAPKMIEVVVNDRLGKKNRVKCCPDDTIGDLKKLISAKTGTKPEKIRLQQTYNVYKDHITLADYEIKDQMAIEMYYN